jgi:hypothetical protein
VAKLVAIVSKQVQLQELFACIRHFGIDHLSLHLTTDRGRINEAGIDQLLVEHFPELDVDIKSFQVEDREMVRTILAEEAAVFAVPVYRSSAIYRRVPRLRRRGKVVHVTDGLGDLFSMVELQRAVLARTPLQLLKGVALVVPTLRLCRADLEFNLFHPRRSAYARASLPVGPFPLSREKRARLEELARSFRPEVLVIDGFDLTAGDIAAGAGITSYIASRRQGGVIVDGKLQLQDQVICAEEVIEVMRPGVVIGCPSTALAAARQVDPAAKVFCITTPKATLVRGPMFNTVFKHYAESCGVTFAPNGLSAVGQLKCFKAMMSRAIPACA